MIKKIVLLSAFASNVMAFAPISDGAIKNSVQKLELRTSYYREVNKDNGDFLKQLQNEISPTASHGIHRIQQKYKGIMVYGSEAIFEKNEDGIQFLSGRLAEDVNVSLKPQLNKREAMAVAKNAIHNLGKLHASLVIYPLVTGDKLCWLLEEEKFGSQWKIVIDAHTGKMLESFNALPTGTGVGQDNIEVQFETIHNTDSGLYEMRAEQTGLRRTLDAKHEQMPPWPWGEMPGELVTSSDDHWPDSAHVDAHKYMGDFIKVMKDQFGISSFDNKGTEINSIVHYSSNFVNAFWYEKKKVMVFGDGDGRMASNLTGALDVISHEVAHAITSSNAQLEYKDESGALNEAFSDIVGTYSEYIMQKDKFDWMLGEDVWTPAVAGDGLRYMNDPKKDKQSSDFYPDRYQGSGDSGGVHLNSGIANLAFYLLSEGGKHPRRESVTVQGIGIENAMQLFYKTFTKRLTKYARFSDAKAEMLKEAQSLGPQVAKSVQDAWEVVGVN